MKSLRNQWVLTLVRVTPYWNIGDLYAPDLVGSIDQHAIETIRVSLLLLSIACSYSASGYRFTVCTPATLTPITEPPKPSKQSDS